MLDGLPLVNHLFVLFPCSKCSGMVDKREFFVLVCCECRADCSIKWSSTTAKTLIGTESTAELIIITQRITPVILLCHTPLSRCKCKVFSQCHAASTSRSACFVSQSCKPSSVPDIALAEASQSTASNASVDQPKPPLLLPLTQCVAFV